MTDHIRPPPPGPSNSNRLRQLEEQHVEDEEKLDVDYSLPPLLASSLPANIELSKYQRGSEGKSRVCV